MMALLSPRLWLAIGLAASLALSHGWMYRAGKAAVRADWADERAQQAEQRRHQERAASAASAAHEKDKTDDNRRINTLRVEVEKIVERPVYLRACFDDDGLRSLAGALGQPAPAAQPGHALPGPAAPR
ncbi:MAG: hypothetical protein ACRECD_01065 [Burkholderiaceae bacterium]